MYFKCMSYIYVGTFGFGFVDVVTLGCVDDVESCRETLVQGDARSSCCFPSLEANMVDPIVQNQLQILFCKRHPIQVEFLVGFMICASFELF